MEPAIQDCDMLLYAPGSPEVGDVMMYEHSSGKLIIHRVIEEEDEGYEFKGDNNPQSDGVIEESQIKSEVHYKTGIGIGENTCEAIFKPPIQLYEGITGNEIILPEERSD